MSKIQDRLDRLARLGRRIERTRPTVYRHRADGVADDLRRDLVLKEQIVQLGEHLLRQKVDPIGPKRFDTMPNHPYLR